MDLSVRSVWYAAGRPGLIGWSVVWLAPGRSSQARPPAESTRLSAGHWTLSSSAPSGEKIARNGRDGEVQCE